MCSKIIAKFSNIYLDFLSDHGYAQPSASNVALCQEKNVTEKVKKSNKKLSNRNQYLQKKIKSLSEELEKCRKDITPESFVEVSEKADKIPQHLLIAHLKKRSGKSEKKYDDTIKNFAISLRLKSKGAYQYIRSCFGDSLPHEKTIQKWCSVVDASPGFNQPALDHLAKLTTDYKKDDKSLFCSLSLDETALRKHMEFTGSTGY